jgi:ATP-dependent exoDNAse (exonuclease V) beta subunit
LLRLSRLVPIAAGSGQHAATSTSQLEGHALVRAADILSPCSDKARARGTLIHAWLERIEWLTAGRPDRALLRQLALEIQADTPRDEATIDPLLDEFEEMLRHPAVAALLDPALYARPADWGLAPHAEPLRAEVRREFPLAVPVDGQLMTGFIDRLVLVLRGERCVAADIVDFKTDKLESGGDALAAAVEFYRPQINAYRRAVAHTTGLPTQRIRGRLVFLEPGRVVDV